MDITKVAVFAMVFVLAVTLIGGGFGFMTGNASYAIPYRYSAPAKLEYPTTMCTKVQVEQGPFCYSSGINACRMLNTGHCFQQCARDVEITCRNTGWNTVGSRINIPEYTLPQGFEDAFSNAYDCKEYARRKCNEMTSTFKDFQQCFMRANLPCSEIGRLKI